MATQRQLDLKRKPADENQTGGARKTQRMLAEQSTEMANAPMALPLVTEVLLDALSIDTLACPDRYIDAVDLAKETAAASGRSHLLARIHSAAFWPNPSTGTWTPASPTWHQTALRELTSSLAVISIAELLHSAASLEPAEANVACYQATIRRAREIAGKIDVTWQGRIHVAAFEPLIASMPSRVANTPSRNRQPLLALTSGLIVTSVAKLLRRAKAIDTSTGFAYYQELVQQAEDVAAASKGDANLAARVHSAAFKPPPGSSAWMATTPSYHQSALATLLGELQASGPKSSGNNGSISEQLDERSAASAAGVSRALRGRVEASPSSKWLDSSWA